MISYGTRESAKAVLEATWRTFRSQTKTLFGEGHSDEVLYEASKRALARITLASSATTSAESVAAYAMIRQDEHDYMLAAAASQQTAISILNIIRMTWGDETVNEILSRLGMSLEPASGPES